MKDELKIYMCHRGIKEEAQMIGSKTPTRAAVAYAEHEMRCGREAPRLVHVRLNKSGCKTCLYCVDLGAME